MSLTFGSLFAGIGGFDLGFERAGMQCKWQVEIDDYARRVLAKHWPDVRRWDDVRTFPPEPADEWRVDVICGGFPCQDISLAGNGAGLAGARSGLWCEYARIIRDLRPRYVVIENVAAITFRGLERVLADLAACGLDAEWNTLSAQMFGAPHGRERVFIVAYAPGERPVEDEFFSRGVPEGAEAKRESRARLWPGVKVYPRSHPNRVRWCPNCEFVRVANGIPDRLDRYRGLGNAVVPQIAEWLGRRIMESQ